MPPVRQQHVLPAAGIHREPRPAAAVLVDPQACHRAQGLLQQRAAAAANASCADGQDMPLPRAASAGVIPRPAISAAAFPQPLRYPALRRDLRHPLGERLPLAVPATALPAPLDPPRLHRVQPPCHIPRPGQHLLMRPDRDRAAVRARRSGRVTGNRPYLQHAVRPGLRIGDLQALHAEQHRRRMLEHDARGFL
jgi:hypothetical protein